MPRNLESGVLSLKERLASASSVDSWQPDMADTASALPSMLATSVSDAASVLPLMATSATMLLVVTTGHVFRWEESVSTAHFPFARAVPWLHCAAGSCALLHAVLPA